MDNYYNIVGDNREKRIFKIPIDMPDMTEDELDIYIKEVTQKFKKGAKTTGLFDYKLSEDIFIPTK